MNLRQLFKYDFARSAFHEIDGEIRAVGKYGQISLVGAHFDLWFVGPDLSPLSGLRISNLSKNSLFKGHLIVLNGEAWYQTKDIELVRRARPYLGIRKRRTFSPKVLKVMQDNMNQARQCKTGYQPNLKISGSGIMSVASSEIAKTDEFKRDADFLEKHRDKIIRSAP